MIQQLLTKEVFLAVKSTYPDFDLQGEMVTISSPKHENFGDFATNIAMRLTKELGKAPMDIANEICVELSRSSIVKKCEAVAPGFINIFLEESFVLDILRNDEAFAPLEIGKGTKIVFEYVSLNVAKPMHIGHLCNAIFGEALVRVLRFTGYDVTSDDHVGDFGTQFGKLICAIDLWGNKAEIEKSPIEEFTRLYIEFHVKEKEDPTLIEMARDMNKKLEDGDSVALAKWQWIVDTNRPYFEEVLEDLGVHFDTHLGESFYLPMMPKIVEELVEKKIAMVNEDGSIAVVFEDHGISLPSCLIQKGNGGSLYHTRDLATIRYRLDEYNPKKIVYVVADQQSLHFQQLFEIIKMLEWGENVEFTHLSYGMTRLPEGSMSTREGTLITARSVLDEALERADVILKEKGVYEDPEIDPLLLKRQIAYGAISYFYLAQNKNSTFVFDWDKVITFEGNSAPYIQYVHARASSLLRKVDEENVAAVIDFEDGGEFAGSEHQLMMQLVKFQDAVTAVSQTYAQNILAEYVYSLAGRFNSFYSECKVLSEVDDSLRMRRLLLVKRTQEVLKKGLELLNIAAPERM